MERLNREKYRAILEEKLSKGLEIGVEGHLKHTARATGQSIFMY